MKTVQAELPEKLYEALQAFIRDGWCANEGELIREALRRFLESHRPDLMERHIREDVEWGLRGDR
jgi:Arc/MetJ-type ribon-helix-helix transcriptional regulator